MGSSGLLQTFTDSGLTGALAFGSCICVIVEQPKHSNKPINESLKTQCVSDGSGDADLLTRSDSDKTHARVHCPTTVTLTSVLLQDIFYAEIQLKVFFSAAVMSEDERGGRKKRTDLISG